MFTRRLRLFILLVALTLLVPPSAAAGQTTPATDSGCDVARANGHVPPQSPFSDPSNWYGSGANDASLWLLMARGTGVVERPRLPVDAQSTELFADGYPFGVVFYRGAGSGDITITATSTDGHAIPKGVITSFPPETYPIPGMVPASGPIPADGCWTFTATDGNDALTWTTLVESPFADCPVTSGADDDGNLPRHVVPGFIPGDIALGTPEVQLPAYPDHYYGEDGHYVALGDPARPVRTYAVDSALVSRSGAISDRFMWYGQDEAEGELTITVESEKYWFPDDPEVDIPHDNVTSGLQFVWITFPGEGCWEVTGHSGDATITFYVRLELIPSEK